jgi:hypothetical protein
MPVAAPPPALEVSVSPSTAGSEAKPKAARLKLSIDGKSANAREFVVYFPKGIAISNKGIADGTKAGAGSITVDEVPSELAPSVTATGLSFAAGDPTHDGVFSQASGRYTAKLRVKVPQPLRSFSALSLDLKAKSLFATRECPLPFRVELIGAKKTVLMADAPCRG